MFNLLDGIYGNLVEFVLFTRKMRKKHDESEMCIHLDTMTEAYS